MAQRVNYSSKINIFIVVKAKASFKNLLKHIVTIIRSETSRSIHEQVDFILNYKRGPNRCLLQKTRMTCG